VNPSFPHDCTLCDEYWQSIVARADSNFDDFVVTVLLEVIDSSFNFKIHSHRSQLSFFNIVLPYLLGEEFLLMRSQKGEFFNLLTSKRLEIFTSLMRLIARVSSVYLLNIFDSLDVVVGKIAKVLTRFLQVSLNELTQEVEGSFEDRIVLYESFCHGFLFLWHVQQAFPATTLPPQIHSVLDLIFQAAVSPPPGTKVDPLLESQFASEMITQLSISSSIELTPRLFPIFFKYSPCLISKVLIKQILPKLISEADSRRSFLSIFEQIIETAPYLTMAILDPLCETAKTEFQRLSVALSSSHSESLSAAAVAVLDLNRILQFSKASSFPLLSCVLVPPISRTCCFAPNSSLIKSAPVIVSECRSAILTQDRDRKQSLIIHLQSLFDFLSSPVSVSNPYSIAVCLPLRQFKKLVYDAFRVCIEEVPKREVLVLVKEALLNPGRLFSSEFSGTKISQERKRRHKQRLKTRSFENPVLIAQLCCQIISFAFEADAFRSFLDEIFAYALQELKFCKFLWSGKALAAFVSSVFNHADIKDVVEISEKFWETVISFFQSLAASGGFSSVSSPVSCFVFSLVVFVCSSPQDFQWKKALHRRAETLFDVLVKCNLPSYGFLSGICPLNNPALMLKMTRVIMEKDFRDTETPPASLRFQSFVPEMLSLSKTENLWQNQKI
jgi:hypothetical protein